MTVPSLVLHSKDDKIVPSYLSERLVNTTKAAGNEDVQLILFEAKHKLRHRYIYRAPGIKEIIEDFVQKLS